MYTNDMTVITDYIAQQTEAVQPLLQHIYDLVHEEVSETVDGWKYGISTPLYKEKPLLGFAATKNGISIYPYGNSTITPFLEKVNLPIIPII